MLDDRRVDDQHEPSATGLPPELERALSAPFVVHPQYGTRCSTAVLVEQDGRTIVCERRFDASGRESGSTRIEFSVAESFGDTPGKPGATAGTAPAPPHDEWPE